MGLTEVNCAPFLDFAIMNREIFAFRGATLKGFATTAAAAATLSSCTTAAEPKTAERPNVIIVLTDDQGIGNLSCLGNEYISTPNIDRFYAQSLRMTDFHVCPLSTPTRSSIISGRYPIRNGAWATFKGRDMLAHTEPTIAEIFKEGGYSTALFGKWHLGDNYPSRATDCGFDLAVQHSSGGVGELSDFWGNSYFDDTYLVNNKPTEFEGYCTDVWFSEAMKYMEQQRTKSEPFFVYLATNAPHSPHIAPERNTKNYEAVAEKGIIKDAGYYGQIENIDENFALLEEYLQRSGLAENTILIFTTDNGAPPADNPWTLGYRGGKSSPFEGGHRVPFFIRWTGGGIGGGVDVDGLAAHVDLAPTLAAMCGIDVSDKMRYLDGIDISNTLLQREPIAEDRTVFIHHRQTYLPPFDEKGSVVMRGKWRLLHGKDLYDVVADRPQKVNLAKEYPEVVKSLKAANAEFIAETKKLPEYQNLVPSVIDFKKQPVTVLTIQHAKGDSPGLWKPEQIAEGVKNKNNGYMVKPNGKQAVKISLARWARECQGTIWGVPAVNPKGLYDYKAIKPEIARLKVGDKVYEHKITADMKESEFRVVLTEPTYIEAEFIENGEAFGAYYIYIEKNPVYIE